MPVKRTQTSWRKDPKISDEKKKLYREREAAQKKEKRQRVKYESEKTTTCVVCCENKEKTSCVPCEKCPLQICTDCIRKMCGEPDYGIGTKSFECIVLKCECGADRDRTHEVMVTSSNSHSEVIINNKAEQLFKEKWEKEQEKSLEEREYFNWKDQMEDALNIQCPSCKHALLTDVEDDFFKDNCTLIYCLSTTCKQNSQITKICGWCWCNLTLLDDERQGQAHAHATYCEKRKQFTTTDSPYIQTKEEFEAWKRCREAKINEQRYGVLNRLKQAKKDDDGDNTKELIRKIRQIGKFVDDDDEIVLDEE